MGFCEFIEKTLKNERGYKYHTYQTFYDGKIFKLTHYGTTILKVDLEKKKILNFFVCSQSDGQAISSALWKLGLDYHLNNGRLVRKLGKDKYEFVEFIRDGWYSSSGVEYFKVYKCKRIYKEGKFYALQNGSKFFIFTTNENYNNRIFYIKQNEEKTILCDRELYYLEEINLINENNNLLIHTNNLKELIEKAKKIAIVNQL